MAMEENETSEMSVKIWDDISEKEKKDIKFIRIQMSIYEQLLAASTDSENHMFMEENYTQYKNRESELEKDIEKKLEAKRKVREKLAEGEDKIEKYREYYRNFLAEHEIYYVAAEHVYMEYFSDTGKWEQLQPAALNKQYAIRGQDANTAFDDVMDELGRKRISIECSFYPKPDRSLNLMRRDHWVQPKEGKPHYAFDLLINSLANNRREYMDHIEQIVYWKYRYPEEYRLPCLVIYGEGGVGKNTFAKELLGTIFGAHQVLVADADKTIGPFNGMIQGKTVVMIDEAIAEKTNAERLKRTVGNKTIDINPKYGKQGEHDNTPLYMAGGNDTSGAILLDGKATDRRWSIIKVEKSIIQRLADSKGISFNDALTEYRTVEHVYTDSEEVAKWVNYLIEKWSSNDTRPVGLHKEDYHELLETQKSPFDELMEMVFGDEKFTHIEGQTLYKLYQEFVKATNPSGKGYMTQRNKFYAHVREWLKRNTTDIVWGKMKINRGDNKYTTQNGVFRDNGSKTFETNNETYAVSYGKQPFWETVYNLDRVTVSETDEKNDEILEELKKRKFKTVMG